MTEAVGKDVDEELSDEGEGRQLKVVRGSAGSGTGTQARSPGPRGQAAPAVEATAAGGRTSVVRKPTPAAQPEGKVEPKDDEQEFVESSSGDEDQKRRWSLFRRGGKE